MTNETMLEVRKALLSLAQIEEAAAATEAARVPYWEPCPASVAARRIAAWVPRADADRLLGMVA